MKTITRKTLETDIECTMSFEPLQIKIDSGIGFLDHMLHAFTKHSGIGLQLSCKGDLHIDDHHTVEDIALTMGTCFHELLMETTQLKGIKRFGLCYCPLDESLSRCVIDISGRPSCHVQMEFKREKVGNLSTEMVPHFFESFATNAKLTLHLDVLKAGNTHHVVESAFKAFARALKDACLIVGGDIPSTKGSL
jgi:imidazoleglycerol-phosphate dehydratase